MGFQGVEFGGVKMAVEEPAWFEWARMPDGGQRPCDPESAELRLRVRPLASPPQIEDAIAYPHAGGVFEIGRCGADWMLAAQSHGVYERVVRLDPTFTFGEIRVSTRIVHQGDCPVSHPIDRGIAAHRAVLGGALVVWGSTIVREGRALVFLGDERPACAGEALVRGWLILRPTAGGDVSVSSLTFMPDRPTLSGVSLHAIHVSDAMLGHTDAPDTLDEEAAAGELLRYAFSPSGDVEVGETVLKAACRVAERACMLHTGSARAPRFAWKRGPTGISARALAGR